MLTLKPLCNPHTSNLPTGAKAAQTAPAEVGAHELLGRLGSEEPSGLKALSVGLSERDLDCANQWPQVGQPNSV